MTAASSKMRSKAKGVENMGKLPPDGAKVPIYLSLIPSGNTEPQGRIILDA